jgi:ComF family protein
LSLAGQVCGRCLRDPPHFDATLAAFVYAFPIDRLEQRFKYGGALHLAAWWGAALAERIGERRADLIVPMPLHPDRLRERGYNQAAEIARHLARLTGMRIASDLCERPRATPPQASFDREARLRNVRDAFACRADVSGRHLMILDDVMTTGASMNELARTLKIHGAASVVAVAAARTLHA